MAILPLNISLDEVYCGDVWSVERKVGDPASPGRILTSLGALSEKIPISQQREGRSLCE